MALDVGTISLAGTGGLHWFSVSCMPGIDFWCRGRISLNDAKNIFAGFTQRHRSASHLADTHAGLFGNSTVQEASTRLKGLKT